MDIMIPGPAGRIDLRHKGLEAKPDNVVVLVQGANLSGQLGYDMTFDGRIDYSMMEALVARGFGAVTFALRGYRKSELSHDPLAVSTETAIDDLSAVMDWVRDQGFATPHLLGWSWGGRIAGHYAARNPARLSRLVLLDPALGGGNLVPFPDRNPWWSNTREYFFNRLEEEFSDLDGRTALADQVERDEPKAPNGIRAENAVGSVQVDPAKLINPTLMLYGHAAAKQDYMQGGAQRETFFAALATQDRTLSIISGGGDYAHIQRPRQLFFGAIADFLESGMRTEA